MPARHEKSPVPEEQEGAASPAGRTRFRRAFRFFLFCLVVPTLLWFGATLALPPTLARNALESWLSEALNAPVNVDSVNLHPLTLRATLRGIRVPTRSGEPFISVEKLELIPTLRLLRAPSFSRPPEPAAEPATAEASGTEPAPTENPDTETPLPEPLQKERNLLDELLSLRPRIMVSLRVTRPVLDIAYLGRGVFSFSDLLTPEPLPPEAAPIREQEEAPVKAPAEAPVEMTAEKVPETAAEAGTERTARTTPPTPGRRTGAFPLFTLSDFKLDDGTFILRDEVLHISHAIENIQFDVPFIRTPRFLFRKKRAGEAADITAPTFSAVLNGTPVHVNGSIRPEGDTLRTTFEIRAGKLDLSRFSRQLSHFTPLRLISGRAEPTLTLILSQPRRGDMEITLSGKLLLEDVQTAAPSGETAGSLKRGEMVVDGFTLSERRLLLQKVELDGLYLKATRNSNGRLDWEEWFSSLSGEEQPTGDRSAGLIVEGADLVLRNADFLWEESGPSGAIRIGITGVDGRIAEYSTRPGARTAMRLSFGIDKEGVLALEGEGTLNPPTLQSNLMIEDLPLNVLKALKILEGSLLADVSGRLDFRGSVRLLAGKSPGLQLEGKSLALRSLSFGRGTGRTPAVEIRTARGSGLNLNTTTRSLTLGSLDITAPRTRLAINGDTVSLYIPGRKAAAPSAKKTATSTLSGLKDMGQWKARIGALGISNGSISRVLDGKTLTLVSDLDLSTEALTLDPGQQIAFTLHTRGASRDMLDITGKLRPRPFRADVRIRASGLELNTMGVFLRPLIGATASGQAEGNMKLEAETSSGLSLRASGDLTLRNAALVDDASRKTLLRFRRFSVKDLLFASTEQTSRAGRSVAGPVLEAAELILDRPLLSLTLDRNGRLSLLRPDRRGKTDVSPAPAANPAPARQKAEKAVSPASPRGNRAFFSSLNIASVKIQSGRLSLGDQRFSSPVRLSVLDLDASLANLSNRPGTTTTLAVRAQVDGSPVRISGRINPFLTPPTADLGLTADNVDLSRYSAYAREYIGHPVEQGRLSLKSAIRTSGDSFSADNSVLLRQLVLGPRDPRSTAPDYPVTIGLSLLSDLNGDINLDVPLRGSLDNVSLEMGSIVGKVLGGLFTRILTSPISLVTGLFGFLGEDEPELQLIPFAPGTARLSRAAEVRVDKIADLLQLRPKLKIRLVGLYEPEADADGLRHAGMLQRLREVKHKALPAGERAATPADRLRIAPEEYENLLFRALSDTPGVGNHTAVRREHPDVMEQKLQSLITVRDADLQALAKARAAAVHARLLGRIPALAPRVSFSLTRDGMQETRSGAAQAEIQIR